MIFMEYNKLRWVLCPPKAACGTLPHLLVFLVGFAKGQLPVNNIFEFGLAMTFRADSQFG